MIYFVRHGETDYNRQGICTGQRDIPLNSTGIVQARATAEQLKNIKFDRCFCSPLLRAKQTCAEILRYHPQVTPCYDARIKERYCGKLEGQLRETLKMNKWHLDQFPKDNEFGVETVSDVLQRLTDFYDELKQHPEENVLVVAHGGIGKLSHAYFYGMPADHDFSTIKIANASVINFNFD